MGAPLRSYIQGRNAGDRVVNFLSAFLEVGPLALLVTIINIGGVGYGIYYYWDQLNDTAPYLIPFVPDSPTGPFFLIIIYAQWWFKGKKRSPTLDLLAFLFLVKFGVWTIIMFAMYAPYFFTPELTPLYTTLLAFHVGEAMSAGILLKGMRFPAMPRALAVLVWMSLGDASDYLLGTHPRLPVQAPEYLAVPVITVALTFITFLIARGWCRHLLTVERREHADTG